MIREELKEKLENSTITIEEIYEIERTLSQDEYFRYVKEVEEKKKNVVVGILLAVFLGSFGGPLFYYGMDKENANTMMILLIVGWLLTYLYIGLFILIAVKIWMIIMVVTNWSKSDEYAIKVKTLKEYV